MRSQFGWLPKLKRHGSTVILEASAETRHNRQTPQPLGLGPFFTVKGLAWKVLLQASPFLFVSRGQTPIFSSFGKSEFGFPRQLAFDVASFVISVQQFGPLRSSLQAMAALSSYHIAA
jgi:hypothetical protein